MANTESVIRSLIEDLARTADDTRRWSQEDSAQIYEGVAEECDMRAQTIRDEMADQ